MDKRLLELFEKMKSKNLFWSYSRDVSADEAGKELLAETVLKYGDVEDIRVLLDCRGQDEIREIWIKRLLFDNRFKKLNFYLAEIFFEIDIERLKKERSNDDRANKLRLLASQNQGDFSKT
ncbi:MAG: hypothetical protein ACOC90_08190 [Bacteroidota bacterium]